MVQSPLRAIQVPAGAKLVVVELLREEIVVASGVEIKPGEVDAESEVELTECVLEVHVVEVLAE